MLRKKRVKERITLGRMLKKGLCRAGNNEEEPLRERLELLALGSFKDLLSQDILFLIDYVLLLFCS